VIIFSVASKNLLVLRSTLGREKHILDLFVLKMSKKDRNFKAQSGFRFKRVQSISLKMGHQVRTSSSLMSGGGDDDDLEQNVNQKRQLVSEHEHAGNYDAVLARI